MGKFVDWSRYVLVEINQIIRSLADAVRFWPDG
jgi:hypothetical protein